MLTGLLALFHDPLAFAFASVLVGIALTVELLIELSFRSARNALRTATLQEDQSSGADVRDLERRLTEVCAGFHPEDGRAIWTHSPAAALETWIDERVLTRVRFVAAGWLTGMALVATFVLIAMVLVAKVGPAIRGGGQVTTTTATTETRRPEDDQLSEAVELMGAKFIVSAIGILATILLQWRIGHVRSALLEIARDRGSKLAKAGISREALDVEDSRTMQRELIDALRRGEARADVRHQDTLEAFNRLQVAVESLRRIEVSIQNIGEEVTTRLSNAIGVEFANSIRQILRELADDLHKKLGDSFSSTVESELTKVTQALNAIERAVSTQAQSQVGVLIEQIRDALSGGYASESTQMRESLQGFASVVPQLEKQLREMALALGSEHDRRSDASAKANEMFQHRVSEVMNSLSEQVRATSEAVVTMRATAESSQQAVASAMDESAGRLLANAHRQIMELAGSMDKVNSKTNSDFAKIAAELKGAIGDFGAARADLNAGARTMQIALAQVSNAHEAIAGTIGALQATAITLEDGARKSAQSGVMAADVVNGARELVAEQKEFATHVEEVWPTLLETYVTALEQTSRQIAESWMRNAEQMGSSIDKMGNAFHASASEFSTGVEELSEAVRKLEARLGTDGASRPQVR